MLAHDLKELQEAKNKKNQWKKKMYSILPGQKALEDLYQATNFQEKPPTIQCRPLASVLSGGVCVCVRACVCLCLCLCLCLCVCVCVCARLCILRT